MSGKKQILPGLLQGKGLLLLARHWKMVVYIFILTMMYITLHYKVDDTSMTIIKNNREIKELKTDFTTRSSQYHELTTIKETTRLLDKMGSDLRPPQSPPVAVTQEAATY